MATQYVTCPNCKTQNINAGGRCSNCGTSMPVSPMPMQQVYPSRPPESDKRLLAGLLGIFLGGLGIHKFVLGYKTEGIIMLSVYVVGLFLCGIPSLVMAIIGIVEGIMYLVKSEDEFYQTYIAGKKAWF